MKISLTEHLAKLPLPATTNWPEGVWDTEAFNHGEMSLILYTPRGTDYQSPQQQDELYIIIQGSGILDIDNKLNDFVKGDVLFVPAGVRHKFIKFTDDVQMWAVFWGEKSGK